MIPIIIVAVLIIGGYFAYMKFFAGKVIAGATNSYNKAQQEFETNEQTFLDKYWSDDNRFKPFKAAVSNESIVGMMSCSIPKNVTQKIGESIKSAITNTNTFDMNLYYLVAADANLHFLAFNGQNCVEHHYFSLNDIQSATLTPDKTGQKLPFLFTCNTENYTFDLQGALLGFPKFEVKEDASKVMLRTQNERNFNPYERIYFTDEMVGDSIDFIVRHKYSKAFIMKLQDKLGIRFPEIYQY